MSSESRKSERTYPKEERVNPWGTSEGRNSSLVQEEGTNHVKRGIKKMLEQLLSRENLLQALKRVECP